MSGLARWCVQRRFFVVGVWVALLLGLGGAAASTGTNFSSSVNLPSSDSGTAYDLLESGGSSAASAETGRIVWHTDGSAVEGQVRARVEPALRQIEQVPGVISVTDPFTDAGANQVSPDGQTGYATVTFDSIDDAEQAEALARGIAGADLNVEVGGTAFEGKISAGGATEVLGVFAALIILLLVFRSAWAAALPILTGLVGVGVSTLLVMLLSHVITLPDTALTLGALIGLGVGVDYALFIVNRHRKALNAGKSNREAITIALNTSGRAVIFAGATVIIAVLGMLVLGINILSGMAIGAAVTVTITVVTAITLLPALLAIIGRKVLRRSDRKTPPVLVSALARTAPAATGIWARWARRLDARPKRYGVAALLILIVLAVPALSMRMGSADATSDPTGSETRAYADLVSDGFGPGFDATLLLVGDAPTPQAQAAFSQLAQQVAGLPGVTSITPVTPVSANGTFLATIVPSSSAQQESTAKLVRALREDVIPQAEIDSGLQVYVGGTTASNVDFAEALTSKLPLFLLIIGVLGFLLLTLAFRSPVVSLIGTLSNLLTLAVGLGAITAIFQYGWGSSLFGVGGAAPIEPFVRDLIVGVVFGLSMDYQVFLVSRMHEEWTTTRNHRRSVRVGLSETGAVIATAAAIMIAVFASFGFAGERIIAEIGVGMAVAVAFDAFLMRLIVIPAALRLIGRSTWSLPGWLDTALPHVSVEGPSDGGGASAEPSELESVPSGPEWHVPAGRT